MTAALKEEQTGQETRPPILVLEHVTKDFGGLRAINDVSIQVKPGERRAIIGPNGAGKTTLFNLITGELPVTSGRIHLAGLDITSMPAHRRIGAGLGRTYQITNIFPGLTVEENIQLAAQGLSPIKFALYRPVPQEGPIYAKVLKTLDDLHLTHVKHVKTSELSYGEQRQLEIALALVGNPKVLLLDEPAAGLSAAERVTIANLIRRLPAELTVVLIEHDMDLALRLVDRVTCLHYGAIIAEGTPEHIRQNDQVREIYLGAG
ncbi:MAG: ABC transporter ATP-binding protein [Caldilineae bacterium]|nr:MAG: ABC transporter ATP-binding protein [Caldilineae bacterium]